MTLRFRPFPWRLALAALLPFLVATAAGPAAGTGTPRHWEALDPQAGQPRLVPAQIAALNAAIAAANLGVIDLEHYPEAIAKADLLSQLGEFQPGATPYWDGRGRPLAAADRQATLDNRQLAAAKAANPVRWGLLPDRANLRLLPTNDGWFETASDRDFDQLQNTALFACDPVAILHASKDGRWLFVQAPYARGWIERQAVREVVSRAEALRWRRAPVVTVLAPALELGGHRFGMGTRLPVAGKQADGQPTVWVFAGGQWSPLPLPKGADACQGSLPLTTANLLGQAFKLLGEDYDWGGRQGRHDCSSFIQAVYRTMGVDLPRNSGDQARIPGGHRIEFAASDTAAQRQAKLRTLRPGAILRLKGHVMLYLGDDGSGPRILHDYSSYAEKRPDGSLQIHRAMRIEVTPLSIRRKSGATFLDALTHAWEPVPVQP